MNFTSATPRPSRAWQDWVGCITILATAAWSLAGPNWLSVVVLLPVLHDIGVAVTFLIRGRAKRGLNGIMPRLIAYGSAFIVAIFLRVSAKWTPAQLGAIRLPTLFSVAGGFLVLMSFVLGLWPLWYVRRSFSFEPVARELVTSGPYAVARHPIYAAYAINCLGLILVRPSLALVIVLVCWAALTYLRLRYEERVLSEAFPAYASYRERVGAFGPRLWRGRGASPRNSHGVRASSQSGE